MSTRASRFDRWLLQVLRKMLGPTALDLVLETGGEDRSPLHRPVATIRFADRRTLLAVLRNPEMGFGDGFSEGRIVVEGDLVVALDAIYKSRRGIKPGLLARWILWTQRNTLNGSRKHIHHHYDLGNDFYGRWLDAEMQYTCAYFPDEDATLEAAQVAKLDHVSRKIWLQPGETVVEAG